MLSPSVGRIVFRIFGSALVGWGVLRCCVAFEIIRTIGDGGGQFDGLMRILAYVLATWGAFDSLAGVLLLLLRNWAKYFAFVTLAVHGALGFFLTTRGGSELGIGMIAISVVGATTLVLCGDINRTEQLR